MKKNFINLSSQILNFFWILFISVFLGSCSKKNENQKISTLFLENYANLEVNGESKKRQEIERLKKFDQVDIRHSNYRDLQKAINRIGDGHVFLKSKKEHVTYESDLVYIPGSFFVSSCLTSCNPTINKKLLLTKIDGEKISNWFDKNQDEVFASTAVGRNYRLSRLLVNNSFKEKFNLELQDFNKKTYQVTLTLRQSLKHLNLNAKCVSGKKLKDSVYLLNVHSFYCEDPEQKISPFLYFKKSLDEVVKEVNNNDKIVLDLRENNGGGDDEVIYLLNHFIKESVFLYEYKTLKTANISRKDFLKSIFSGEVLNVKDKWLHHQTIYTTKDNAYLPKKSLSKNKMITLVSAGCFSSCEGAAEALSRHKRSLLVGSVTHGGQSEPHGYQLKGGEYDLYLPSAIVYKFDKSLYEGVGVSPHITLEDDFKTDNDDLLSYITDYPFQ